MSVFILKPAFFCFGSSSRLSNHAMEKEQRAIKGQCNGACNERGSTESASSRWHHPRQKPHQPTCMHAHIHKHEYNGPRDKEGGDLLTWRLKHQSGRNTLFFDPPSPLRCACHPSSNHVRSHARMPPLDEISSRVEAGEIHRTRAAHIADGAETHALLVRLSPSGFVRK